MPHWMSRRGSKWVGQRAGGDREQQKRQPVGHHRETGERGGLNFWNTIQ
jgi:hypothetical protein